jgi:hypothetical protein
MGQSLTHQMLLAQACRTRLLLLLLLLLTPVRCSSALLSVHLTQHFTSTQQVSRQAGLQESLL